MQCVIVSYNKTTRHMS